MGVVWFEFWLRHCPEALFGFSQSIQAIYGMVLYKVLLPSACIAASFHIPANSILTIIKAFNTIQSGLQTT